MGGLAMCADCRTPGGNCLQDGSYGEPFDGKTSEPVLRSYQRELMEWLQVKREEEMRSGGGDFTNLPLLQSLRPEMPRMNRLEKKERGWKVPEPNQCRGRLAEAVLLFLVNLTRPIDQRHQPVPKFRSARREQEPRLVVKTTKRRMKPGGQIRN